jgi:cardiolipin synthase
VAVVLLVLCSSPILYGGHIWAAVIILSREVLVSGLREYLGELQVSVPVTKIAKWKTTVQLVSIGFLIAGPAGDTIIPYLTEFGLALLWVAAGLTLYTGYDYFRAGIRHVVD